MLAKELSGLHVNRRIRFELSNSDVEIVDTLESFVVASGHPYHDALVIGVLMRNCAPRFDKNRPTIREAYGEHFMLPFDTVVDVIEEESPF